MTDVLPLEPTGLGVTAPFRAEVPVTEFEAIKRVEQSIAREKNRFSTPDGKPQLAQIIEEIIILEDIPNEAKIEAFRQGYEIISEPGEREFNISVAKTLIDIIRQEEDSSIRIRMAAIVSHDLQDEHYWPTRGGEKLQDPLREKGKQSHEVYKSRLAKQAAFEELTRPINENTNRDPRAKPYQRIANYLLNPGPTLQVFNKLYDWDTSINMTPRIIEEITEETDEGDQPSSLGAMSAPGLVRLHPPNLPTLDKMVDYERETGRPLPYFLVWKEGAYFISVEFPLEFTQPACDDWLRFRAGDMSREEVFDRAEARMDAFIAQMTPEQKAQMEEVGKKYNLHIRFSTKRSGVNPAAVQELRPPELLQAQEPQPRAA